MMKLLAASVNHDDPIMVIGSKGRSWLRTRNYTILNEAMESDSFNHEDATFLANKALEMFLADEIGKIQVVYTEFINTVTFRPTMTTLLPQELPSKEQRSNVETMFEPSADEILEELIPMAVRSRLYSLSLETRTSEQASRRMAMENANDNAEELNEKLVLQYNQARQAAITQEIAEIVAGADSL